MPRDSAIADILLPLALEGPYSYRVPPGMVLEPGSYVVVPLGPRQMIGVVWALKAEAGTGKTLRDVAGVFDMAANVLYLEAVRGGMLSVVAVVASLYPASTVALAFAVDKERVGRWQAVGMALAVPALVLVTLSRQ